MASKRRLIRLHRKDESPWTTESHATRVEKRRKRRDQGRASRRRNRG